MARGRGLGRAVLVVAVAVVGGLGATHSQAVATFYQEIYPSDPAKRQALDVCFMQDHLFNRLDAGQRDACYRHLLNPGDAAADEVAAGPPMNPVDLERVTAQGNLPRNDIRRQELEETLRKSH